MKEVQPVNIGFGRLTTSPVVPTLEVRGPRKERGKDIFMPDGQNSEIPQPDLKEAFNKQEIKAILPDKILSAKDKESIREEWNRFNAGRAVGVGEKGVQEDLIEKGIRPVGRGPAVWKNGDFDEPIVITGYLGKGPGGRDYVSREGSSSGVPLDEIEYPQAAGAGGGEPPQPPETATAAGGEENEENENTDQAPEIAGRVPSIDTTGVIDPSVRGFLENANSYLDSLEESEESLLTVQKQFVEFKSSTPEQETQKNIIMERIAQKIREVKAGNIQPRAGKERTIRDPELKAKIDKIQKETNEEEKKKLINETLTEYSPHTEGIDSALIYEAVQYESTLDHFVNRIIAQPLDAELSQYQRSFYGGINLEAIKDILKSESESNPEMAQRYRRLLSKSEAVEKFHTMNLFIHTKIDGFVDGSATITPEMMQIMQNIKGVSSVVRILDGEFMRISARDKYINDSNYNEILGDRSGLSDNRGTAEQRLRDVIKSSDLLGEMEEWEIKWAFNSGKILYNLWLRAAEQISLGKVPGSPDAFPDERWASIPQETAARLMNWMSWTGVRFDISAVRGGIKLTEMTRENYQIAREEQGYRESNIEQISHRNLDEYEDPGMFGVSGIWSSWRQNLIILKNLSIVMNGIRTNVRDYIQNNKGSTPESLRNTFLDENGSLRKELNSALAVILKHGSVTPTETDSKAIVRAKEEVRKAIWERVAEDNPLAMASFIHGTKLKGQGTFYLTDNEGETGSTFVWDSLTAKLAVLNEIRINKLDELDGNGYVSLDEIIAQEKNSGEIVLTDDEQKLLGRIRDIGKNDLAKELANVRFGFNPFMNDILFEKIDYREAGAQFYGRRVGNDIPSIYNSYNEFVKLMDNPGGISPQDALEVIKKMVGALGQPLGTGTGQDKAFLFFQAYLKFIETFPGQRQLFFKVGKEFLNQATSIAQEFGGPEAPSWTESKLFDFLKTSLKEGVLRKAFYRNGNLENSDLFNKMRKKMKLNQINLMWEKIRDYGPIGILAFLLQFFQSTSKEKLG